MVRAKESVRALDQKALRSLGQSDDLDQPYDRIRELAPGELNPGLVAGIGAFIDAPDGRCAMHRLKSGLTAKDDPTLEDAGALAWIETMEGAIARGEVDPCRCARC